MINDNYTCACVSYMGYSVGLRRKRNRDAYMSFLIIFLIIWYFSSEILIVSGCDCELNKYFLEFQLSGIHHHYSQANIKSAL